MVFVVGVGFDAGEDLVFGYEAGDVVDVAVGVVAGTAAVEPDGLVDAESRKILGATIFGVGGDEAIHSILAAMYAKETADFMTHSMYIHPTVAELIPTVFGELKPLV